MNNWSGRKVLITGAGGFIGSHLAEELVRQGASVRAMVRYNARSDWGNLDDLSSDVRAELDVVAGDVRDPFFVDSVVRGSEVVFHLAALIAIPYSYIAPESYVQTNVVGTLNVLQASLRHEVSRVVHTSTSETYGTAQYTPIDESHPLQAQSPYSATKIGADKIAESYFRSFGLPVTTVRPFNTYGPRQSARAIVPTIISQALSSDAVLLGSLTPVRDLTYVTDTVAGFLALASCDSAVGDVVNLGTAVAISIGDLASKILTLMHADVPIRTSSERVRPERSEVFTLISSNKKASSLANWRPVVSLDTGLSATIEWMREATTRYRPERYTV